jgi:hypothetical protein
VIRYPETRHARRVAKRQAAREEAGKFGPDDPRQADRRQAERRADRTPEDTERILNELGIADRRRAQRRRGGDRRR